MPYGAKRRRGQGGYASKGYSKRRKIKITKKEIMKALGVEVKTYDSKTTISSIGATWFNLDQPFFDIVEGPEDDARIGNKITVVAIMVKGIIRTISTRGTAVRVMLVLDKICGGATVASSVFMDASNDIYSFNDINSSNRFVKLMDKTIDVPVSGIAYTSADVLAGGEASKSFQKYKTNLNIEVNYKATAGVITDLTTSNLMLWICSDFGAVSKATIQLRIRYTDV